MSGSVLIPCCCPTRGAILACMDWKATLLRVLKAAQGIQYESFVYRTLLETMGRPGWRDEYQRLMRDTQARESHYEGLRESFERVEREESPDKAIQALLRALPETDKPN